MAGRSHRTVSAQAADLPRAELDILAHLWNEGPSTSKQIRDALAKRRPMALGSTLTFLSRLERKGLARRQRRPGVREYIYRATARPEPACRRLLDDLTERVFGGSYLKLANCLFKGRRPTESEIASLRELLADIESNRASGR
jgi:predicted transcriptional regulator